VTRRWPKRTLVVFATILAVNGLLFYEAGRKPDCNSTADGSVGAWLLVVWLLLPAGLVAAGLADARRGRAAALATAAGMVVLWGVDVLVIGRALTSAFSCGLFM